MSGGNWFTKMFRLPTYFNICSAIKSHIRYAHENSLQSWIGATTSLCITWYGFGEQCHHFEDCIKLTQTSKWWMMNCADSNQVTLSHWFMVHSWYSQTQYKHNWQWCLVNSSIRVSYLQHSPLYNNVLWNVCFKNSTWICNVLGCWLSHCKTLNLLYELTHTPTSFLLNSFAPNEMASIADFAVIHPLCISINNRR